MGNVVAVLFSRQMERDDGDIQPFKFSHVTSVIDLEDFMLPGPTRQVACLGGHGKTVSRARQELLPTAHMALLYEPRWKPPPSGAPIYQMNYRVTCYLHRARESLIHGCSRVRTAREVSHCLAGHDETKAANNHVERG